MPPSDDQQLGSARLLDGKYRLGRVLGEGGMGAVYEAEHVGLRMKVAVKLLNEIFTTDESAMTRFRREARAAAAIRHKNVVTVTDNGMDAEGVPFIVMELVEGESLSALLRRERVLAPLDAANITCQISAGLQAAHERGVIHRDLKPGNVLVLSRPDGGYSVKILDFGISKFFADASEDVTATGAVVGTPRFMAPEQARAQADLDERVDIYAVGVLLYRMLTGKLPFSGRTQDEVIEQTIAGRVKPPRSLRPEISEPLQHVVLKAMALDRDSRFNTASGIVDALHKALPALAHLQSGDDPTGGTTSVHPSTVRTRRHLTIPLYLVAFSLIGGLLAYWLVPRRQPATNDVAPAAGAVKKEQAIRFGITRYMPQARLRSQRAPLVRYLRGRLGRPVELVISDDFVDLAAKLSRRELNLAALASCDYVRAKQSHPNIELIASHVTRSGTTYRGYILSRADSGIHKLTDLRGKVFCYTNVKSCSGYVYPRVLFRRHGMDPDRAFTHTRFSGDHLRAMRALHHKACDGASVYAGLLFQEKAHGFAPQDFRIISTTDRIPFDAYCTPRGQSDKLTDALREALLALRPNSAAAHKALGDKSYITGFVVGDDSAYERVPIPPLSKPKN